MGLTSRVKAIGAARPSWAACLLGLLAFAAWDGGHILSPTHIGWVMAGLDTPAHYLGWTFFRHAPWWQWPLGANLAYGSDAPGTIVLTDGIPVAAFFFKTLSPLLPTDFQYFGIWLMSCFILQGLFGYKLMTRVTQDCVLQLLGCGFFLTATVFLSRVYLHPALAAQWILLAAFYLCFDTNARHRAWWCLLAFASLVHAYLLVMAGSIWLASTLADGLHRRRPWLAIAGQLVIVALSVTLIMWIAGYFVPSAGEPAANRSYTDLLTPIWTGWCVFSHWSALMPCLNISPDVRAKISDGFGYFGLGYLLLLPVGLGLVLLTQPPLFRLQSPEIGRRPALIISAALLMYAIGNHVYFGNLLLISYHQPAIIEHVSGIFRGAARMEWLAWYLLLFAVLGVVATRLQTITARIVLSVALAVQCADLSLAALDAHRGVTTHKAFPVLLVSTSWAQLVAQHRHIVYVPNPSVEPYMISFIPTYLQLAYLAAVNRLTINAAYLARIDVKALISARDRRANMLAAGKSEESTFYVVEDALLWSQILCAPARGQWHGLIDGVPTLIPDPQSVSHLPSPQLCGAKYSDNLGAK